MRSARAYQYLANFSSNELRGPLRSIDAIDKGNQYRWHITWAITGRWSEIDPESLFAYSLSAEDANLKKNCVPLAIQALAKRDRARAHALVNTIEDTNLRRDAALQIIRATAEDDPKAALTALTSEAGNPREYDRLFTSWGAGAPQEACCAFKRLS